MILKQKIFSFYIILTFFSSTLFSQNEILTRTKPPSSYQLVPSILNSLVDFSSQNNLLDNLNFEIRNEDIDLSPIIFNLTSYIVNSKNHYNFNLDKSDLPSLLNDTSSFTQVRNKKSNLNYPLEFSLSFKSGRLNIKNHIAKLAFGLEFDVLFPNNIGISYSLLFSNKYVHTTLLPVAFPYALANAIEHLAVVDTLDINTVLDNDTIPSEDLNNSSRIGTALLMSVMLLLIPEGINYNFRYFNDHLRVSPFINPLQVEYIRTINKKRYFGGGIGLMINSILCNKTLKASVYYEHKIHYHNELNPGFLTGFKIGYIW